jgi:methyl-accepting chemotaxis protein
MKSRTLGFKLVSGGVLIVAVPLIVAGVISAVKSSSALEDAAKAQMISTARHLADNVKSLLNEEMKIATGLSADNLTVQAAAGVAKNGAANAAADVAALDGKLTAFMAKAGSDYEGIFIADAGGTIYADGNGGSYKGIQITDREYFKAAKSGKVNVGDVIKSKRTGLPVAVVCSPVMSNSGAFAGVLVIALKVGFIADKVSALRFGQTGYAYMIDKSGLVLAHAKQETILKVNAMQEEGMKDVSTHMTSLKTGSDLYTYKGVRKMAGYAPVETTGWSIAAVQNMDELLTPSRSIRNYIFLTGLVFLLVTLAVVLYFTRSISAPIGRIARGLDTASDEVTSASSQIATTSQELAAGAAEQASSLEEIASSMEEMSSMSRRNADNAQQAKAMMKEAQGVVTDVDQHMSSLSAAMTEIARSSEETANILKTIDEIAFQTNLLALNAAVEAARAGEVGAGFAVVAEEVRNLALRASEAAKNTSILIENTMDDVKNGTHLTQTTKEAFNRNMEITTKIGCLVEEIASASDEQVHGIEQVGRAVAEMDKVTQQTAANAEESASASEEMNAQAVMMKDIVMRLTAVIDGCSNGKAARLAEPVPKEQPQPAGRKEPLAREIRPEQIIPFDDKDFRDF